MNKSICSVFLFLIQIFAFILNAEAVTITELNKNLPDYWSIKTQAHNRTISINSPVFSPDVETLPVLRVKLFSLPDEAIEIVGDYEGIRNDILSQCIYCFSNKRTIGRQYYIDVFQNVWQKDRVDFENIHASNQQASLESVINRYQIVLSELYNAASITAIPYKVKIKTPYLNVKAGTYQYGNEADMGELTGVGDYLIEYWPAIRGIPILMGNNMIYEPENTTCVQTRLSMESYFSIDSCLSDNYWCIYGQGIWEEIGIYRNDYELCDFTTIQNALISLIEDGRIREIYSIVLGYVIYANPDIVYNKKDQEEADMQEYLAIPTWIIETSYANNAEIEYSTDPATREDPSAYDYSDHDPKYTTLLISAQTGRIYNKNDKSEDRVYSKDTL